MTGSSEADDYAGWVKEGIKADDYAGWVEEDRQRKILKSARDKAFRGGTKSGFFYGGVTVGLLLDAAKTGNVLVSLSLIFIAPAIIAWIVWKVLSLLVKVLTLGRRTWSELARPLDRVVLRVYTALQAIWRDDRNDPPSWNERVGYQPTGVVIYIVFVVWILLNGGVWAPTFT